MRREKASINLHAGKETALFVEQLDPGVRQKIGSLEQLATQLRQTLTRVRQRWPRIALSTEDFVAFLANKVDSWVRSLGRGAMAVVYRAFDRELERPVALKVIGEELREHPEVLQMFLQEAKAMATLNHPNIAL